MFPERFSKLPPYAFPRLRALLDPIEAGGPVVHMTIGEPKHAFPEFVPHVIAEHAQGFGNYPVNEGMPELLEAIAAMLKSLSGVSVDPDTQVIALNGTREGLYNAMMALAPETKSGERPLVLMPNPFYQVYMVAALSVGAQMMAVPATAATGHLPDLDAISTADYDRASVFYLCSPSNPQGAVATEAYWRDLIARAERHDFKIFADECYADIYRSTRPTSALKVAQDMGADPERVVIFQSLSKRSNVPGLRSGFAAGGPQSIARMRLLRAYSGAPLPMPLQHAARALWADDTHVAANRALYQDKYTRADQIFAEYPEYQGPEAGFFLWLKVRDGEEAAKTLWQRTGIRVLPGAYLAQGQGDQNPGHHYIRVALVEDAAILMPALEKLRDCMIEEGQAG